MMRNFGQFGYVICAVCCDNLTLLGEEEAKIVSFHVHDLANWMEVFCNVLQSWKLYTVPLVPTVALFPLMQWTGRAQFVVQELPSVYITFLAWGIASLKFGAIVGGLKLVQCSLCCAYLGMKVLKVLGYVSKKLKFHHQLITWELKGVKIDTFKRLKKLLKKGTTADFHQESERIVSMCSSCGHSRPLQLDLGGVISVKLINFTLALLFISNLQNRSQGEMIFSTVISVLFIYDVYSYNDIIVVTVAPGLPWYGMCHTRVLFCVYSMEGALSLLYALGESFSEEAIRTGSGMEGPLPTDGLEIALPSS
ncbi:very-long-chain (3R)-3-hydroxyacyl-CoA dehydratase [Trifolium repens]|nr:very-long-chain (3R)-3-hydroxyacyl-CoA dehydratase [Trifolium repens]